MRKLSIGQGPRLAGQRVRTYCCSELGESWELEEEGIGNGEWGCLCLGDLQTYLQSQLSCVGAQWLWESYVVF